MHRDIKPGNILIMHDLSIKLIDFGLSREIVTLKRQPYADLERGSDYTTPENSVNPVLDFLTLQLQGQYDQRTIFKPPYKRRSGKQKKGKV